MEDHILMRYGQAVRKIRLQQGLSQEEISQLLVLDIKDADYFRSGGAPSQHGGGSLFAQDPDIMGWLFSK